MIRFLYGVFFVLMSFLVYAAESPPALPEVSYLPMIVVVLILVGMVVGFLWYIWAQEGKRKQREDGGKTE